MTLWLRPDVRLALNPEGLAILMTPTRASSLRSPEIVSMVVRLGGSVTGPVRLDIERDSPLSVALKRARVTIEFPDDNNIDAELLARAATMANGRDLAMTACQIARLNIQVILDEHDALSDLLSRSNSLGDRIVHVIHTDDPLDAEPSRLSLEAAGAGRPLILASPRCRFVTPVLSETGLCLRCTLAALRSNRLTALTDLPRGTRGPSARIDVVRAAAATLEVATRWAIGERGLEGRGWSTVGSTKVLTIPSREECSCANQVIAPKRSIHPYVGLIRALSVTRLGPNLHVARAEHSLMPELHPGDVAAEVHALQSTSEGKGKSSAEAKAGAFAEAVERICGIARRGLQVTFARSADLGHSIGAESLLGFSDLQYESRRVLNPLVSLHNRVPRRVSPDAVLPYVTVRALSGGSDAYVPAAIAWTHADQALETPRRERYFTADSNGCAAAPTVELAITSALLELIERDAVAIWWYSRLRRPEAPRFVLDDATVAEVRHVFKHKNRTLHLLDITSDLGVPIIAAVAPRVSPLGGSDEVVVGFAAGMTLVEAAVRAALEAAQFLPMLARLGGSSARFGGHGPDSRSWWEGVKIAQEPWLLPDPAAKRLTSRPVVNLDDLLERLADAGLDAYWLDQSQSRFDIRVVRTIVPGLRHFWRRLAPGRLYDVPVSQGLLANPLSEADMNPHNIFF